FFVSNGEPKLKVLIDPLFAAREHTRAIVTERSISCRVNFAEFGLSSVEESLGENVDTTIQCLVKCFFLGPDDLLHLTFLSADLGENIAHRVRHYLHQFEEERFMEA